MTPEEVVASFIGAIEKGDVEGALAHMSPDCEYDNVPMAKAVGHDAIRQTLGMFVGPDVPTRFEVLRQTATGSVVMNERIDRLQVFGKPVELPVVGVWEVKDGKITLWRDYFDLQSFSSQVS